MFESAGQLPDSKKAPNTDSKKTHFVQEDNTEEDLPYQLYAIKDGSNNPITMEVSLNDVPVTMELGHGSISTIKHIRISPNKWAGIGLVT